MFYFLADLSPDLGPDRTTELINSFARTFHIPMSEQRLAYGLWLLDDAKQPDVRAAVFLLC